MENISENITYEKAIYSATAKRHNLDNAPDKEQLENMQAIAEQIYEPLIKDLGVKVSISSFFRSAEINKLVGGSVNKDGTPKSQHCKGEAMDLQIIGSNKRTNKEVFDFIQFNTDFDQLIWEFGTKENPDWVHVSYTTHRKNRRQILVSYKTKGVTNYKNYK